MMDLEPRDISALIAGMAMASISCLAAGHYFGQWRRRRKPADKKPLRRLSIIELTPDELWRGIRVVTQSGLKNGYVIVSRSFSSAPLIMVYWEKPEEEILAALKGSEFSIEDFMMAAKTILHIPGAVVEKNNKAKEVKR